MPRIDVVGEQPLGRQADQVAAEDLLRILQGEAEQPIQREQAEQQPEDQEDLRNDRSKRNRLFHAARRLLPFLDTASSRSLNNMFSSTVNAKHSNTMNMACALA